ncbi:hypothetical protein PG911_06905 [Tenacibaculum ovolyticum]|uniref:hypothetical protein n=1 Tax=Tenacibaculum ovolyticum TaxID=104270 RepID=UPI0022F3933C|nr:hypothetical protein [Tenacibaculum ovolyticum]WBX77979.1 hypothetical protein PG911_06905 [Tenacibaculum ovolyticum]
MLEISNLNFKIEEDKNLAIEEKIVHNKKSRKNKIKLSRNEYQETIIKWVLFEYLHPVESNHLESEFFPLCSSKFLNNGVTVKSILLYLNSNIVFDFYRPKENDKINIRMEYKYSEVKKKSRPYIGDFISLILKEEWEINENFEHINNCYQELKKGKLIIT